jgi:hypothetical protein
MSGPFWLARPSSRQGGVDHLGLRQPGLTMADALLPGITNRTDDVRYYTVASWMLAHARDTKHLRELEFAFIHATRQHTHVKDGTGRGVGIRSVPWASEGRFPLQFDGDSPSVFDAVNYGPSVRALGLGSRASRRVTRFAQTLAQTLELDDEAVPASGTRALDASAVARLGQLCLCTPPTPSERELLEELLFRHERARGPAAEALSDGPRRRSLALLLHALEPSTSPRDDLLQRFVDWQKGFGSYAPPEVLCEEAYGFAVLAARWFFRHAVESIWAGFGRMTLDHPVASTEIGPYVDRVLAAADGSTRWAPKPDATLGLVTGPLDDEPGVELDGLREIESYITHEPDKAMLGAAVQLAALALRMPRLQDSQRVYRQFPHLGHVLRVGMVDFAKRATADLPLRDWLGHLVARYAVGQHFLTATRKWFDGIDGFFFHPTARGYEIAAGILPWSPQAGPTKINAALSLLRGIDLVNIEGGKSFRSPRGDAAVACVCARPQARDT